MKQEEGCDACTSRNYDVARLGVLTCTSAVLESVDMTDIPSHQKGKGFLSDNLALRKLASYRGMTSEGMPLCCSSLVGDARDICKIITYWFS